MLQSLISPKMNQIKPITRQKFDTENRSVLSEFNTKLCNVICCFEGSALQEPFSHLLFI